MEIPLCECGCEAVVKPGQRFLKGHNRRGVRHSAEVIERLRSRTFSAETRARMSASAKARERDQTGERNPNWKGGSTPHSDGYVYVHLPDDHPFRCMAGRKGYVLRSRLVLAEALGRPLTPEETVHHENEVKDDDRIENLRLFATKGEHVAYHHAQRRAVT